MVRQILALRPGETVEILVVHPCALGVFWHVDDLPAAVARLLSLGAKAYEPITERGEGFVTASVVDPFGNILGVMSNAHYLEVLGKTGGV